jgi:galactokinase/mevalonate kinase-like predicted kinase
MKAERGIVCSAPGRASIIGNPTDMYGGSVISCSVDMRAYACVTPASGLVLETRGEICRIVDRDDLRLRGDLFDVARAILSHMQLPPLKCRVQYGSEIPMQSGLSGSTALLVALLQALLTWQGRELNRYRLAERARSIELNHLNVVCGYQDAYMCTFGGLNYIDFRGKAFHGGQGAQIFATVEPLAEDVSELPFVLGYTGEQHSSGQVHRPILERWLEGEQAVVEGYDRITEIARVAKTSLLLQDWPTLGDLMNENHAIQRDLGGSGASNEQLITAALTAGALGAKLAGAGSGGTIIALWPWQETTRLEETLHDAGASGIHRLAIAPGVTRSTDVAMRSTRV